MSFSYKKEYSDRYKRINKHFRLSGWVKDSSTFNNMVSEMEVENKQEEFNSLFKKYNTITMRDYIYSNWSHLFICKKKQEYIHNDCFNFFAAIDSYAANHESTK